MKSIGVGIIGCGAILPNHLFPILNYTKAKLVAVCDIDREKTKVVSEAHPVVVYEDYMELLNDPDVDVVHILLPHYLHTPVACSAMDSGKHVVLEKPVGISFDELQVLKQKADETGKVVGVTFQNRFNPTTEEMKRQIGLKTLGDFLGAKGIVTWSRDYAYYMDSAWRGRLATEGGGVLINQAIHTLDLMEYIGGPVKSIDGVCMNTIHPYIEVEDAAMLTLTYESGAVGNFYATNNYADNSNVELEFFFEKGKLRLYDQELYCIEGNTSTKLISDQTVDSEKSYWGKGHYDCIHNIYDHITEGALLKITLDEAIKGTRLVLMAYEADRKKKEL